MLREARAGAELLRFDALARSLESATGDALKVVTTDKFMDLAPTTEVWRDADGPGEAMIVSHAFPVSIAYAIFPRCVMDFGACGDLLVSAETGEFALVIVGASVLDHHHRRRGCHHWNLTLGGWFSLL